MGYQKTLDFNVGKYYIRKVNNLAMSAIMKKTEIWYDKVVKLQTTDDLKLRIYFMGGSCHLINSSNPVVEVGDFIGIDSWSGVWKKS